MGKRNIFEINIKAELDDIRSDISSLDFFDSDIGDLKFENISEKASDNESDDFSVGG